MTYHLVLERQPCRGSHLGPLRGHPSQFVGYSITADPDPVFDVIVSSHATHVDAGVALLAAHDALPADEDPHEYVARLLARTGVTIGGRRRPVPNHKANLHLKGGPTT